MVRELAFSDGVFFYWFGTQIGHQITKQTKKIAQLGGNLLLILNSDSARRTARQTEEEGVVPKMEWNERQSTL
jgi:hypothetical protein